MLCATNTSNIDTVDEESVLSWRKEKYGVYSAEYSSGLGLWCVTVYPYAPNLDVYWSMVSIGNDYYDYGLGARNPETAKFVAEFRLRQLIQARQREYMANHPFLFANLLPVPGVKY